MAYKLSSFGMSVALATDGSDLIDLMAEDILRGIALAIQVKTARNVRKTKYWEWSVGRQPLVLKNSKLVYVFIDLREDTEIGDAPTDFIVPSADVVAQAIRAGFLEHPE
ncbi:hypothetical protein ACFL9U_17840 [Thermodesulfobacteriota bacterium]